MSLRQFYDSTIAIEQFLKHFADFCSYFLERLDDGVLTSYAEAKKQGMCHLARDSLAETDFFTENSSLCEATPTFRSSQFSVAEFTYLSLNSIFLCYRM